MPTKSDLTYDKLQTPIYNVHMLLMGKTNIDEKYAPRSLIHAAKYSYTLKLLNDDNAIRIVQMNDISATEIFHRIDSYIKYMIGLL